MVFLTALLNEAQLLTKLIEGGVGMVIAVLALVYIVLSERAHGRSEKENAKRFQLLYEEEKETTKSLLAIVRDNACALTSLSEKLGQLTRLIEHLKVLVIDEMTRTGSKGDENVDWR